MVFLRAFLIGISIAAPVGPIGVLCIRRTLSNGKLAGFLSGMGAATADMVYGAIAAFGLTFITNLLVENAFWLKLVGGLFLLYLGIKTFLEKFPNCQIQLITRNNLTTNSHTNAANNINLSVFWL